MFTVRHVNQLPGHCDAQLRLAVTVAFAASASTEDASQAPPLLLMRLTRSHTTGLFGVVGHHLAGSDPVVAVGELSPEDCRWDPREDHLGALVATNLWVPGDWPSGTPASDGVWDGRDRIIVGVTMSGWSLAIRDRFDGAASTCQAAEPSEFGKIGDELSDALAALNRKFSQRA